MQVSDLEAQLALQKRKGKGKKQTSNDDEFLNHEMIVKLGKKYVVMVHPWPIAAMFMRIPPSDAPDPESKQRYASLDSYEAGLIQELHVYLNDKDLCEGAARYAPFKTAVSAFAANSRMY